MKYFLSLINLLKWGTKTPFQGEMIKNNEYKNKIIKNFLVLFNFLHKTVSIVLFKNKNNSILRIVFRFFFSLNSYLICVSSWVRERPLFRNVGASQLYFVAQVSARRGEWPIDILFWVLFVSEELQFLIEKYDRI